MAGPAGYIDLEDITAYGYQVDLANNTDLFNRLIPRASEFFDILCGVEPGHFNPAMPAAWQSEKHYSVGDIVTPRTPNGHRYIVTTAGTSGTTEPTFPTATGGTVGSGSQPVFTEAGPDAVATEKVIYGSGGVLVALPPYVGTIVSVTVPSSYSLPTFVEETGFLRITTTQGEIQEPGFNYSLVWGIGVPYTVKAIWGYDKVPENVKQATVEILMSMWREKDPAFTKAVALDTSKPETIPERVRTVARSFRNARPSTSAFV
jgi:hypothetical protein